MTATVTAAAAGDRHWIRAVDGRRLRQVRREHGLSQERLAASAGVSITTIVNLERQPRTCCKKETLARLAEALGENPDVIVPAADPRPDAGPGRGHRSRTQVFPARLDQVRLARALVTRVLGQDSRLLLEMALVCSELAANSVTHSASARPGGEFTVTVEVRDGDYAWVEVADQGGPWREVTTRDSRGRGLDIVDALTDYWDIRGSDKGRTVCARIDWPGPDDDAA